MEFIVLLIIMILIYIVLRFMFDVNINELKQIGEDKELDELKKRQLLELVTVFLRCQNL